MGARVGVGGLIFINDDRWTKFKAAIGQRSNNMAELMALKLTLIIATQKGIQKFHVFGDSKLVVDWLGQRRPPMNIHLGNNPIG